MRIRAGRIDLLFGASVIWVLFLSAALIYTILAR